MRIRGEISHELMQWTGRADRPLDYADIQLTGQTITDLNPSLFSPENAAQLAVIREHCIQHPQGILLDTYQSVTELELKYPSGSPEAKKRYSKGLHEEVV